MFTGIVETIGTVVAVEEESSRSRVTFSVAPWADTFQPGESIAVDGVCLTVASFSGDQWTADVMKITRETTTLGQIEPGTRVNLERAMRADGRFGGHIMQGHVDGTATLVTRDVQPEWVNLTFDLDPSLVRYVVRKGSIALQGTSLTVAELEGTHVTVSLIPTTLAETTFGDIQVGAQVNVEVDVVAKYVERLVGGQS